MNKLFDKAQQGLKKRMESGGGGGPSSSQQQQQQPPDHHQQQQTYNRPPPPPPPPQDQQQPMGGGGGGHHHQGIPAIPDDRHAAVLDPQPGTYPRLARVTSEGPGVVVGALTSREGGKWTIYVSRSTDGGRTFAPRVGKVTGPVGDDNDNAYLLEVPASPGNPTPYLLCAFRNHEGPAYRITVCRSDPGPRGEPLGTLWAYAGQAHVEDKADRRNHGVWEPFMRLDDRRPGAVQLTYSRTLAPDNQETYRVDSSDGGHTWSPSPPACLQCHPPHERIRDGMQGIVQLPSGGGGNGGNGGPLVIVFETNRHPPEFSIEYQVSHDGGRTWPHGARGVVHETSTRGHNNGSPQIATHGRGDLCAVWMSDEDWPPGPEKRWPGRAVIKASFARGLEADGRTIRWSSPPLAVSGAEGHWPGVIAAPDGVSYLVSYELNGTSVVKPIRWDG